jgi:hypothetical protein
MWSFEQIFGFEIPIVLQSVLIGVFGFVFMVLTSIVDDKINTACEKTDTDVNSSDIVTKNTLMYVLLTVSILMFGMGLIIFIYHRSLDKLLYLLDFFYKWGSFIFSIPLLVCSAYLLSMVDRLNCIDDEARSIIKQCCWIMVGMSIIFVLLSIAWFYLYVSDIIKEGILKEAEEISEEITIYNRNNIDYELESKFEHQIKILTTAVDKVGDKEFSTKNKYKNNIIKLKEYKDIAEANRIAFEIDNYLKAFKTDGTRFTLEEKQTKIRSLVCNKEEYSDTLKLEIINQLNRVDKSLKLTNCEELEKFVPETGDTSFDTIKSLSRKKEIEEKKQEIIKLTSPEKSPEKSPEQLELERLRHESEVKKLKREAFIIDQEMEQARIKTEKIKNEQPQFPQFPQFSKFPQNQQSAFPMPHLEQGSTNSSQQSSRAASRAASPSPPPQVKIENIKK